MRVLLVNTLFPPDGDGGAERSVAELAEDLQRRGIEVRVAALTSGEVRSSGPSSSVPVYRWKPPGAWPFSPQNRSLRRKIRWHAGETYRQSARTFVRSVLRDFRPHVVHTNNIAGFGVSILRDVSRYPWVHTLRDYYLLCPRTTLFRDGARCEKRCFDCVALTRARRLPRVGPSQVVGVSDRVTQIHQQAGIWAGARTSVIPNSPQQINLPYRYVERITTVGFLGRLNQSKGVGVLVELLTRPELRSLHLVVAGPRGTDVGVGALLRLPNVTDLGVVHPGLFFSKIDLLLVPSQWEEPFGRVLAEGRTVAVPALVSSRGGLANVADTGDRVRVVENPASVDAWVEAITSAQERWQRFWVGSTGAEGNESEGNESEGNESDSPGSASSYIPIYQRALVDSRYEGSSPWFRS